MGGRIAISGAHGFIAQHVADRLKSYEIIAIPRTGDIRKLLSGVDVVINLAGAPINHYWSKSYKRLLYDSRINSTRRIVHAINSLSHKPLMVISASAVGVYSDGFLSSLCMRWEEEAQCLSPDVNLAITRFGVVLSMDGGALPQIVKPMRYGFEVVLGTGKQDFPWIAIGDLCRGFEFIIDNKLNGRFDFVAPSCNSFSDFTRVAAAHYGASFRFRVPAPVLGCVMGESAQVITDAHWRTPVRLLDNGFSFNAPDLHTFFAEL